MNDAHAGHFGDVLPDGSVTCGYGWAHGMTGCTAPATIHLFLVEPAHLGTVRACHGHADQIRAQAARIGDEHPHRRSCARQPATWNTDPVTGRSWCSP